MPVYQIADKQDRQNADDEVKSSVKEQLLAAVESGELPAVATLEFNAAYKSVTKTIVRGRILAEGVRMDGRGLADIRPLDAEVQVIRASTVRRSSSAARPRSWASPR